MLAQVRTTVLPEFGVYVYPTYEGEGSIGQRYLLVLQDGTTGALQLEF